jgi:hypothetical protein
MENEDYIFVDIYESNMFDHYLKSLFITFCSNFMRLRFVLFEGDLKVEGNTVSEHSVNNC